MMEKRKIEWAALSKHRGELMGIAIILIVLFHVPLPRASVFFGVKRMGNIGVDIFFFLSGIGLWYAWCKNPDTLHFYKRRLLRILPAWLTVSTAFYLPDFMGPRRFSSTPADLIGDITINWDFWRHDELTFWYIPATLALYLIAPLYMRMIRKNPAWTIMPVLMMAWCVAVQYIPPVHSAVGHIEIFWSRIPVFLTGIVIGRLVKEQHTLPHAALRVMAATAAVLLTMCIWLEQAVHGRFPIFLERMMYIPLTVAACMLLAHYLERLPAMARTALTFTGSISLEIYLLHSHFILARIQPMGLGYWVTFALCMAITLPAAWLLHTIIEHFLKAMRL